MRAKLKLSLPLVVVMILGTTGCGAASEEEQIAGEVCDLLAQLAEDPMGFDMDMLQEMDELEARAEAAGLSDLQIQEAIENECPDVFEDMDGLDF